MTADKATQQRDVKPGICRIVDLLSEISGVLAGIAMILATLITGHGVFVRYVLKHPTTWQTEATIYLLIAVAFLGASYAARHNAHVGVDLLPEALPLKPRLILKMVTTVMLLAVVAVVAWTGGKIWLNAYAFDTHSPSAWGPPLWIPYFLVPMGMTLVFLQYLGQLIEAGMAYAGRLDPKHVALLGATGEAAEIPSEFDSPNPTETAAGQAEGDSASAIENTTSGKETDR